MIRLFEPDEVFRSANDLRSVVRATLQHWRTAIDRQYLTTAIDLRTALPVACQAENTQTLIEGIVELAVNRCPPGGELSIVGFRNNSNVELEIADCGPDLSITARRNAFSTGLRTGKTSGAVDRLDHMARSFGGRLSTLPCPQGGIAWTLFLPSRAIAKRAA